MLSDNLRKQITKNSSISELKIASFNPFKFRFEQWSHTKTWLNYGTNPRTTFSFCMRANFSFLRHENLQCLSLLLYPTIIIFVHNWRLQCVMCSVGGVMWLEVIFIYLSFWMQRSRTQQTVTGRNEIKMCNI